MDITSRVRLRTGRTMPVIGLGTWQLKGDTAGTVNQALALGYPMIDTSGDYGTQPGIGEGIKRSGVPRDSMYLVTKVEETDDAYESTKNNLGELGLSYADLMLIHRPPGSDDPGEELWAGLMRARDEGLARDIGVSNYSIKLMKALIKISGEVPAVNQIEWSPFGHSEDMYGYCIDNDIIIQAYSPLTRTEKLQNPTLNEIAERCGKTPAQILLRWNVQMGTVPLPKTNRNEHLAENIDIFDFEIDDDDMATLNGLNERYSSLGSLPYE